MSHNRQRKELITSEDALRLLAGRYGLIRERQLPNGLQGAYVPNCALILLDERLGDVQRRCVLAHEISHARHRDAGCMSDRWVERRADMEASALLVNPVEYAFAEQLYEGDVALMARELDVMPWVVDAYRQRLHDDPMLVMQ